MSSVTDYARTLYVKRLRINIEAFLLAGGAPSALHQLVDEVKLELDTDPNVLHPTFPEDTEGA